ncbi:NADH-quinone oxidoreductase subunit NuoI [Limisalsivibrio acetivorans]|uniref:NADH-quinone oxidoreductase subunit NuoI n=1 Tax=Limisalsivibrio acetivorans TaxID=1304888 RepID=UPI0003B30DF2|nr:NADH-quinone oxidoreductase subunit NuoI [Limisalsivibrio acetivorans]
MKNVFDTFFFTEILQGLGVTMKHFFKKKVTYKYPYEDTPVFPRFRGIQYIKTDEEGVTKCVGCYLCQVVCPSECIHIVTDCGHKGQRLIRKYELDLSRCIYCGYCEEACPVDAIHMGRDYHTVDNTRDNYVVNMKTLTQNYKKEQKMAEAKGEQL